MNKVQHFDETGHALELLTTHKDDNLWEVTLRKYSEMLGEATTSGPLKAVFSHFGEDCEALQLKTWEQISELVSLIEWWRMQCTMPPFTFLMVDRPGITKEQNA